MFTVGLPKFGPLMQLLPIQVCWAAGVLTETDVPRLGSGLGDIVSGVPCASLGCLLLDGGTFSGVD